ncbi:MAG: fumarate hydratase [Oscillospiraceae bacterium]|jgi:fumarate hydratase subunit alpha|nr:fumarate hydratase [Oscillospiraceae bacterium]
MREISVSEITAAIARLCVEANKSLPADVESAVRKAHSAEENGIAKDIMRDLCENLDAARALSLPVCQDTGMAVVFLDMGQDAHVTGGDLTGAVNAGVEEGYVKGRMRLSVVGDPMRRANTNTNAPAIIHTRIVPGDRLKITVAPKGFGSENMSGIAMLNPSASREQVMNAVVEIVRKAGSNPCPPMVVGVGIGGDFELSALLAKRALTRPLNSANPDPFYGELERDLLEKINGLNIGPQGFGGKTTALAVNVEQYATHIAGLPVAVNIGCHVNRHGEILL